MMIIEGILCFFVSLKQARMRDAVNDGRLTAQGVSCCAEWIIYIRTSKNVK